MTFRDTASTSPRVDICVDGRDGSTTNKAPRPAGRAAAEAAALLVQQQTKGARHPTWLLLVYTTHDYWLYTVNKHLTLDVFIPCLLIILHSEEPHPRTEKSSLSRVSDSRL